MIQTKLVFNAETMNRGISRDRNLDPQEELIINHKDLGDRRVKYGFYRSSINTQLKHIQLRPTEFGKYGEDSDISPNSFQSPQLDKYPKAMQYNRKARILDKFAQCVNPMALDAGISILDNQTEKLPYIYKQNSSNLPFQRERNLNSLMAVEPENINRSSQQVRRVPESTNHYTHKFKNRNNRELTSLRNPKERKDTLHIHKSFSFKSTSKRDRTRPKYSYQP